MDPTPTLVRRFLEATTSRVGKDGDEWLPHLVAARAAQQTAARATAPAPGVHIRQVAREVKAWVLASQAGMLPVLGGYGTCEAWLSHGVFEVTVHRDTA